ncbi:hypothetical protein P43SY_001471 [Pythium insidiosum]|uniref:Uncharacterized protein n=1 Tax=Pythium insidiosum TaxID=114742 RepID=A0AAD5LNQ8_PYTIN|nr:hypothetical protein P43SY_001471 [Pythium insidiosum]
MPRMRRILLAATTLHVALVGGDVLSAGGDRSAFFQSSRAAAPVDHPLVQDAANFAVDYLRSISDSGIYETLRLVHIEDAATQTATFHDAIHLCVSLASPYFKSGNATEQFQLVVLEGKEPTGIPPKRERSIAIDEFPVMDEDAIEAFWIQMVETRRAQRRQLFERWEQEAREAEQGRLPSMSVPEQAQSDKEVPTKQTQSPTRQDEAKKPTLESSPEPDDAAKLPTRKKKKLSLDDLHAMSTKQLRKMLTRKAVSEELRDAITSILDERWDQLEQQEESQRDEL